MKTLDDVIAYFDNQTQQRHVYLTEDAEDIYNDALHYLKYLQKYYEMCETSQKLRNTSQITCPKCHSEFVILPEANNPLTWDELKQMVGKPVWLEDSNQQGEWVLLSGMEDDELYFVYRTCNEYKIYRKEQGTLWKAYRKERS